MLVNSREAAAPEEGSHHGLHNDVGGLHERTVERQAGPVGLGPLRLHCPAVGFPRGQQVLDSLQKEGREGSSGRCLLLVPPPPPHPCAAGSSADAWHHWNSYPVLSGNKKSPLSPLPPVLTQGTGLLTKP